MNGAILKRADLSKVRLGHYAVPFPDPLTSRAARFAEVDKSCSVVMPRRETI
jgi:hypothetical protein